MAPRPSGIGTRRGGAVSVIPVDDGEFDYDEKILVETSQKAFRDFWIRPSNGVVNQQGPFMFEIQPENEKYLHLNATGLEVKYRVVHEDGSDLSLWEDVVAPVNLLGSVMWEQVEVFVNGHAFPGSTSINCGLKAFIESLLSYDLDARHTHLHSQFFYLDSPGQYGTMTVTAEVLKQGLFKSLEDGTDTPATPIPIQYHVGDQKIALRRQETERRAAMQPPQAAPAAAWQHPEGNLSEEDKLVKRKEYYEVEWARLNTGALKALFSENKQNINRGFNDRFQIISGSSPFDTFSPLTHDFFKLNNHVGPGNRIDLRLTPHKNSFLLNSYLYHNNYKLVIDDMRLHLRTIERRERIPRPLVERYRMNETQMHKQLVGVNSPSAHFRIHNGGVMPKTVILAMVTTRAGEGDYKENPFYFHHFHMTQLSLNINGEQYPSGGLHADFLKPNHMVSRLYRWVYDNSGSSDANRGNLISFPAFQAGSFVIPFDLTPDKCNSLHTHDAEYGYIDVDISFAMPLSEPIYVLYELVFPKVVVNDKENNFLASLDIVSGG